MSGKHPLILYTWQATSPAWLKNFSICTPTGDYRRTMFGRWQGRDGVVWASPLPCCMIVICGKCPVVAHTRQSLLLSFRLDGEVSAPSARNRNPEDTSNKTQVVYYLKNDSSALCGQWSRATVKEEWRCYMISDLKSVQSCVYNGSACG